MRGNKIQTIWENGGAVINGWLHIPHAYSAEIMAHQGFDSLTVDMQHGPIHYDVAVNMLTAVSTTDTVPMARVPWNEPGIIMKMLDVGCYGIICPMVNTRAECEAFVGACHYPPYGYRSNGPNRARIYGGPDYVTAANDTILAIAMVETKEAVENLDDILSVPHLDGIYVGPSDLSISLRGEQPADLNSPELDAALDTILAACEKHNIPPGIHCFSAEHASKMIAKGFKLVTIQADSAYLSAYASQAVAEVRNSDLTQDEASPY